MRNWGKGFESPKEKKKRGSGCWNGLWYWNPPSPWAWIRPCLEWCGLPKAPYVGPLHDSYTQDKGHPEEPLGDSWYLAYPRGRMRHPGTTGTSLPESSLVNRGEWHRGGRLVFNTGSRVALYRSTKCEWNFIKDIPRTVVIFDNKCGVNKLALIRHRRSISIVGDERQKCKQRASQCKIQTSLWKYY